MKVVIVGGVAAGMSAATRLRRLNETAKIVVFEKGEFVSFANCGLPYHIGGTISERANLLVQTPEALQAQFNLDVRVFSEVIAIDRDKRQVEVRDARTGESYNESYDKLVLAMGAKSFRPPIPGLDLPNVLELRNIPDMDRVLAGLKSGARKAVVMGGFIGIEAAENLRERGVEVVLVERMTQLMGPLDPEMAWPVQQCLESHGIEVRTGAGVCGFEEAEGRVKVLLESGDEIEVDLVVSALGSQPLSDIAREAGLELTERGGVSVDAQMRTSDPHILAAGDVIESVDFVTGKLTYVPLAGPANRQGRLAADTICGRDVAYRGTQGTSILKVFELTVATTGLNEKALRREAIPYRKIYLHPYGHAGYYPGTAPMHIKMLFSPEGDRILGAQIVGYDGVDKRIDVIATAMRGRLSVQDLEHLELAYAPPYGSAKDPVNMAGFIATNIINGDVEFWHTEELEAKPDDVVLIDVRSAEEHAAWHLPGARLHPLPLLRSQLDKLRRDRCYWLYCSYGLRSYLAYRIMRQLGYRVKTLIGGSITLRAIQAATAAACDRF